MATLQGKVQIHVSQDVTLENLQAIIARIAGMTGCPHLRNFGRRSSAHG